MTLVVAILKGQAMVTVGGDTAKVTAGERLVAGPTGALKVDKLTPDERRQAQELASGLYKSGPAPADHAELLRKYLRAIGVDWRS